LFLSGGVVHFTFSRAGDALELASPSAVGPGVHEVTISYVVGAGDTPGRMQLDVDHARVDSITVEGMLPMALQHGGAGLRIGYDSGFPVSPTYAPPAPFSGTVDFVRIEAPGTAQLDAHDEIRAALHSD
jgi:arylsulfatase